MGSIHFESMQEISYSGQNTLHEEMQKYGIEVLKTIKCALEIDRAMGTTYWGCTMNRNVQHPTSSPHTRT